MRKGLILFLVTASFIALSFAVSQADSTQTGGEALFRSLHCTGCHRVEGEGVGISLQKIAKGYAGKERQLYDYLSGKGEALLNPARAGMMVYQVKKTEKLSEDQRKALVDYLLLPK